MQSTGRAEGRATGFNRIKPIDTKGSLKDMKYEVDERKENIATGVFRTGWMSQTYKGRTRE